MKHVATYVLLFVWSLITSDLAEGSPLPQHPSNRNIPIRSFGLSNLHSSSNDYSDAIYAARFAVELDRLEKLQNDIYADFITSGFAQDQVPRELPANLKKLSRTGGSSAFPLSHSGPVGFRFPANDEVIINRPRSLGGRRPTGFVTSGGHPFRRTQGPVFSGGFRSVGPAVSHPDPVFSFNHRFGSL